MTNKLVRGSIISALALLTSAGTVLAHVVVGPAEVGIAVRQDFSVGVPNEKDIPTVAVRVVLPEGLGSVTPYVKPGWQVSTKTSGEGEDEKVTEISWTGGEIGKGLRDAFVFRAMTPTEPTTLVWKAYQTYSDGTVVSWDQEESEESHGESEDESKGPYSETQVVNDLETDTKVENSTSLDDYTVWASYGALLLAAIALAMSFRGSMNKK